MKPNLKRNLFTILKVSISLFLIFWIFRKIDWEEVRVLVSKTNFYYLFTALFFFILSHGISIIRFDIIARKVGIRMDFSSNAKLYMLGMFYNFFLPGGVGGDAYKVYLLKQTYDKSIKEVGQAVFIDRFLGVIAIGFLLSLLVLWLNGPFSYIWNLLFFLSGLIFCYLILRFTTQKIISSQKRINIAFFYSIWIQILQMMTMILIFKSLGIDEHLEIYLALFLVSSILSVVSFAGLGVREAVFYYGAEWFKFNPDISAMSALTFSIITAIVSLLGILYISEDFSLKNKTKNLTIKS